MVKTRSGIVYNAARAAGYVAPYAQAFAVRTGQRVMQNLSNRVANRIVNERGRQIEPAAATFQNDNQNRYTRKRMPRRKRKAWKKFTKKVRHVELQAQPLQVYTYESTQNLTSAANQGQVFSRICGGTTLTGNDEIYQIFQGAYNVANVAACAPYKIYIKSICMDIQMTNTGSYPIIVDVYTIQCRSKFASAVDVGAHLVNSWNELQSPAGGGSVTTSKTALTPFDAPNFCSYWKILKKKEYIIGSNNTVTLQLRNPKNRHVEGKDLASSLQTLVGHRAFLFTWHGQPSNRGGSPTNQFDPTTVTFGYQTVIHYAVPPSSTVKEAGKTA